MKEMINLKALDALRGVLALYVMAGHARWLLWQGHAAWVSEPHAWWANGLAHASRGLIFGREAVMVFFVVSGFFIHFRMAGLLAPDRSVESFSVKTFILRRAHRLLPPYALALLLTVLFDLAGRHGWPSLYHGISGDLALDAEFARKGYSWASVVPALLLLPSSLSHDFGTNGPLWSLAFEVLFYSFYPFWLWVRQRSFAVAFLAVPALCFLVVLLGLPGFCGSVLSEYSVWLGGAALAEMVVHRRGRPSSRSIPAVMAVIAGFGVHFLRQYPVVHLLGHVLYGMGIVLLAISISPAWSEWRLCKLFEWLGVRSYSLYIMHFPLLVLVSAWAFETYGARPASGWLALGGFVAAIAFGCGCFALCEKHFLHERLRISEGGGR